MSITKVEILTFANGRLRRSETDIDVEVQIVLDDLSDENLLIGTDLTKTLSSGKESVSEPDGYREMITIRLNDGTDDGLPLKKISRNDYLQYMENGNSSDYSESGYYNEFNGSIYFYPVPDGNYTIKMEYYKKHANDVDTIAFDEEFRRSLFYGVIAEVAIKYKLMDYINIWLPRYENEKSKREANASMAYIID